MWNKNAAILSFRHKIIGLLGYRAKIAEWQYSVLISSLAEDENSMLVHHITGVPVQKS
jgi:hypothetical protein